MKHLFLVFVAVARTTFTSDASCFTVIGDNIRCARVAKSLLSSSSSRHNRRRPLRHRMSASGYCEQCQHDHIIPTTTEALAAAVELIRSLESSGRVDFDVSTAVGIEEGVQTSDPRLNVSFLVEERGKMLGVLIATDPRTNTKVVLKAFSGKLNGHWSVSNWAPALYAKSSTVAHQRTYHNLPNYRGMWLLPWHTRPTYSQ